MPSVPIPFSLLVGDGAVGYAIGDLTCTYRDAGAPVPPEVAAHAAHLVAERQRALGRSLTNEPSYRLTGFEVASPDGAAGRHLRLHLARTNYFEFVSTNLALDAPLLAGGRSIRESLIRDVTSLAESPLANPLSVMIIVVSQTDQVAILPRRSQHVAFDQGCRQASAGGAMRLAVDCDEALAPSPFVAAQRETAEELGVRLPLEAIRFLGLGVDTRTGEPELLGVAHTRLSAADLKQAYRAARAGNDEFDSISLVPFTILEVGRLLTGEDWCPGDWVCCWLALVAAFGAEQVSRAVTWHTCHGVRLPALPPPEARRAPGRNLRERLQTWRKGAPLPLRMGWGAVRRLRRRYWLWDHPEFKTWYASLQETERWPRERLEALQLERLRALLEHAYAHVPYYHRVFDERRLKPADITTLEDLRALPILTRDDVRRNIRDLVARDVPPDRLHYMMTGGTTGTPLGFYWERDVTFPHEEAFRYRQWRWAGYRFGDRIAYLRGYEIRHRAPDGRPAFWDYIAAENALVLSIFGISERSLPLYARKLRAFRPRFIQGYPSALTLVARHLLAQRITDIRPRAIFTEFENLYPEQRAAIQEAFGCPVLAGYGHTERAVDAVECLARDGYHISMEYGIVELTDARGQPVAAGEPGFITGTGLDTYCMPFIRYQTDDVARLTDRYCACGRHMPLLSDIVGRWQHELIVTRDDRYIPITSMNVHSDAFEAVEQYQFLQERKGELIVRLVRRPSYAEADTQKIIAALQAKFRGEMDIRVVFVPEIARTRLGKFRLLDQKLDVAPRLVEDDPIKMLRAT